MHRLMNGEEEEVKVVVVVVVEAFDQNCGAAGHVGLYS